MKNFNPINKIKNKTLKIIFNKTNQPNTSLKFILALHLILHILDICIDTPYIIIFIQFFT